MKGPLRISDAAGLAIHAVHAVADRKEKQPLKKADLARMLNASEATLAKIMNRLAQLGIVASRRGPQGGFVLGPRAERMSLLDLLELFEGPLTGDTCLLGLESCPFKKCMLGKAYRQAARALRKALAETPLVPA